NIDAWIGFRQGKVGMAFEGIYMLADLQKQKDLEFGGAPLPQLGPVKAAWAASHTPCLRADLKGRELEATWRFVEVLWDHGLDWQLRNATTMRCWTGQRAFEQRDEVRRRVHAGGLNSWKIPSTKDAEENVGSTTVVSANGPPSAGVSVRAVTASAAVYEFSTC